MTLNAWPAFWNLGPPCPPVVRTSKNRKGISAAVREYVYARDNLTCRLCGKKRLRPGPRQVNRAGLLPSLFRVELATLDHIIPWADGGCDHPHNLRTACGDCNSKRGRSEA